MALGAFTVVATEFLPIGMLPYMAAAFDVPIAATGLLTVVPGLTAAAVAPVAAAIRPSIDRRVLLAVAAVLVALSNLVVAVSPTLGVAVAGRVGVGLALGLYWTIVAPTVMRLVSGAGGIRAVSIVSAGTSLGIVAGMPVGALAGEEWRTVYLLAAVLAGATAMAIMAVLPRVQGQPRRTLRQTAAVLADRPVRVGLLAAFAVFTGQFTVSTFLGAVLNEAIGSPWLASAALAAFGVLSVCGTLLAPFAFGRHPFATVAGTLCTLTMVLSVLGFAEGTPVVGLIAVLWGFVWGAVPFVLQGWLLTRTDHREVASAALVVAFQAGIGVGSLTGSAVVAASGPGYQPAFLAAGAICALATVGFIRSARRGPLPDGR